MNNESDLHRDLGILEAQVATLNREMREVKNDLRIIRDLLSQARGGWRTLAFVCGLSATVGGLLAKFLGHFH